MAIQTLLSSLLVHLPSLPATLTLIWYTWKTEDIKHRKDQFPSPNNLQCPEALHWKKALPRHKVQLPSSKPNFGQTAADFSLSNEAHTRTKAAHSPCSQAGITEKQTRQFLVQQQSQHIMVKHCCLDNTVCNQAVCETEIPSPAARSGIGMALALVDDDSSTKEVCEQKR